MVTALLLIASAHARSPGVEVTPAGTVRGSVVVPVALDEVREALSSSVGRATAVDNGARIEATADGECELEHTHVPHPIKSVTYTVRTCPTQAGFHTSLVDSRDLDRFEAIWELREIDGGTEVSYDLDLQTSLPLPGFVIRASIRKGVLDALSGIERAFAR